MARIPQRPKMLARMKILLNEIVEECGGSELQKERLEYLLKETLPLNMKPLKYSQYIALETLLELLKDIFENAPALPPEMEEYRSTSEEIDTDIRAAIYSEKEVEPEEASE